MAQRPMPKTELLSRIVIETDVTKKDADGVLSALSKIVADECAAGRSVVIPGIGKIESRERPEGTVRNPRTGETMLKPAHRVPKVSFSKVLKDALN